MEDYARRLLLIGMGAAALVPRRANTQGTLAFLAIADKLIDVVGKLGTNLATLAKGIRQTSAEIDGLRDDKATRLNATLQEQMFGNLFGSAMSQALANNAILARWPELTAPPSDEEWTVLRQQFTGIQDRLRITRQAIASYQGDLRVRRPDLFLAFDEAAERRAVVVDSLMALPRPRSLAETRRLNDVRRAYEQLAANLRQLVNALSDYHARRLSQADDRAII